MPAITFHRKKVPQVPKPPRKKIHWRPIIAKALRWGLIAGVPVIVLGLSYFIFFSRFFTIDFVDVKYDPGVDASRVRSLIFDQMDQSYLKVLTQKNMLLFDEDAAKQRVWDAYALDKLVIEKQYPRTLSVTVVGTPFSVAWLSAGKWYHIDGKGNVAREIDGTALVPIAKQLQEGKSTQDILKERQQPKDKEKKDEKKSQSEKQEAAKPESASVIPLVVDVGNEEMHIGSTMMSQEKITFIIELREKLKSSGIPLLYIKTSSAAGADVTVVTDEGWDLLLNSTETIDRQTKKLDIALKERIKDDRKKLQYVDVRFDNRVYYK